MRQILLILMCFYFHYSNADVCKNPTASPTFYTTQDGTTILEVAFIATFNLKCNGEDSDIPLYAEIDGNILPVIKSAVNKNYFISLTDDVKKSRAADYTINLYDEESHAALRKSFLMGDDPKIIKPLVTISARNPGASYGPWINTEFLALIVTVAVWYFAFTCKSKI